MTSHTHSHAHDAGHAHDARRAPAAGRGPARARAARGRARTALAAALVVGVTAAVPLAAAPAWAAGAPGGTTPAVHQPAGAPGGQTTLGTQSAPAVAGSPGAREGVGAPNAKALQEALRGLPDRDATAALVRVGGDGVWRGSAGVHDLPSGRKAWQNARFRAGSTTKVVTAAIVLRLAAEGRIDLDGTVQEYLPGLLSDAFEPITVRHLLTYTSGLQPGADLGPTDGEGFENRFVTLTPEEVVAASVAKGPYRGPGEGPGKKQRYGNIGYTVLGMLIEKVTGDSYEHQAQVRVFRPAGMRHTSFPGGPDPRIHGPHNRGYQRLQDGRLVDATEWNVSDRWAAGDMISTTADLERLLHALFRGKIVPQPLLEREMFTLPKVEGARYSAGLQRFVGADGTVVWGKTGARPGYATVVAATRDLSRTLVYSVNATNAHGELNPVGARIIRAVFPSLVEG